MQVPGSGIDATMGAPVVRAVRPADRAELTRLLVDSWGSTTVVGHGVTYDAAVLPGFVAECDGRLVGLLTYHLSDAGLEVVTIDARPARAGVGSALLATAVDHARAVGLTRLWLVTTNDNLDAVRFYQRRGLRITAVAPGAVDAARMAKPAIPLVGAYGIELHDELVLELRLTPPGPPPLGADAVEVGELLDELRDELGCDLPAEVRQRLLTAPPGDADAFAAAVFAAEGADPGTDPRRYRQVRARIERRMTGWTGRSAHDHAYNHDHDGPG